jgi:ribosomal protein S18 acetylase RimI-like enzyme
MKFIIRSMAGADTPVCAALVCNSSIGDRYGFTLPTLTEKLILALDSGGELFVAEIDSEIAGFSWIDPRGAFSSAPYLRLIAVDENFRGNGVGSVLMHEFEMRTIDVGRDYFLLVSDFNEGAIRFYEQHGYKKRGELPDFAKQGITEIIMVKSLKDLQF